MIALWLAVAVVFGGLGLLVGSLLAAAVRQTLEGTDDDGHWLWQDRHP